MSRSAGGLNGSYGPYMNGMQPNISTEEFKVLSKKLEEMQKQLQSVEQAEKIREAEKKGFEAGRQALINQVKTAVKCIGWVLGIVSGIAGTVWMVAKAASAAGLL